MREESVLYRMKGVLRTFFKRIFSEPMGIMGFVLVSLIILIGIFAPLLAPHDPLDIDSFNRLEGSSRLYPLGTDNLGRDTLSRLIFGTRIALVVSLTAISFGIILALFLGITAGYSSQLVENLLIVFFDIIKSFPALLLAITIIALTGPSLPMLILIIGFTRFPAYARLIRAQTLRIREREFVLAAEALGCSRFLIMFRHILPNVIGSVFIQAAMDIPVVITFEAGLSFLGLGVPPPTPSWGAILRTGYRYIRTSPSMVIYGGVFLILATLGFTLFGEALRDALDPRLRKLKG